jgi:hypothetical protein
MGIRLVALFFRRVGGTDLGIGNLYLVKLNMLGFLTKLSVTKNFKLDLG